MNKSESKYYNTALLMDEALLILLEKKEFEFITVKEICQKAGVNRSTFYLHYENTSELLEETIGYINNKIKISFSEKLEDVNQLNKNELFFITPKYLIPYLTLVKENKTIFKLVHNKPHVFKNKQTSDMLYHDLFTVILTKYNVSEDMKKYVFTYFTEGVLAVIMKWVEYDCFDDVDIICNLIINLVGYQNNEIN